MVAGWLAILFQRTEAPTKRMKPHMRRLAEGSCRPCQRLHVFMACNSVLSTSVVIWMWLFLKHGQAQAHSSSWKRDACTECVPCVHCLGFNLLPRHLFDMKCYRAGVHMSSYLRVLQASGILLLCGGPVIFILAGSFSRTALPCPTQPLVALY